MMEILINSTNTVNTGLKIVNYSNDFVACTKRIESIIDSINNVWDGEDSLKYINIMKQRYILKLEEIGKYLEEYGIYLQKIPDVYNTLDEVVSSKNIEV